MASPKQLPGLVVAAHGRHYTVELSDGSVRQCFPRGKKSGPAVGDHVLVQPQGEAEGVIERIEPRRNLLYRSDDMRTKQFAANIDLLLLVVAVEPAFSPDLIGRALVAARHADISPVIILNKADITQGFDAAQASLDTLAAVYEPKIPVIPTNALDAAATTATLLPYLQGRRSLLLGQSGMGKSSLLNALVPQAQAATQEHSVALDAGRHTTTSTRLYHLPNKAGTIIDSPGFQNFGLFHLSASDIEHGFPEFARYAQQCRFYNCTHRHEPGCGVLAALKQGSILPARHELYQRLLAENEAQARY